MERFKEKDWDYSLLLPILLLLLLSIWVQFQAAIMDGTNVRGIVIRQILFCLATIIVIFGTSYIPIRKLLHYAPCIYLVSLGIMSLLIWFHDPVMYELTQTKRWLSLGGLSFQPSELVKITFTLFFVSYTMKYKKSKTTHPIKQDVAYMAKSLLYSAPTFFLMYVQRDFGTSLVFIAILAAIYIISGVDWRILAVVIGILTLVGGALIYFVFVDWGQDILAAIGFKEYQLDRIRAWHDPLAYKQCIAFQQVRSMQSITIGGLSGRQSDMYSVFVPVRESDMIFTVIAETFGFIGSSAVLFLYFYLFYRILVVALSTNNRANLYFAVGFVFGMLFQTVENVGAAIGLLPLTGIPLPFLSQGGTSLITLGIGLGIILGMHRAPYQSRRDCSVKLKTNGSITSSRRTIFHST